VFKLKEDNDRDVLATLKMIKILMNILNSTRGKKDILMLKKVK